MPDRPLTPTTIPTSAAARRGWTSGTLADHKAVLLDPALLRASRTGS